MLLGAKSNTCIFICHVWGWFSPKILDLKKKIFFFAFYFFYIFFPCYYCSLDLKRQSKYSGFCPHLSSLVLCSDRNANFSPHCGKINLKKLQKIAFIYQCISSKTKTFVNASANYRFNYHTKLFCFDKLAEFSVYINRFLFQLSKKTKYLEIFMLGAV